AFRYLHLGDRKLVGRRRHRKRGHRRHLRARPALGPPDGPEGRLFFLLLGERGHSRQRDEREHQAGGGERQHPRRWSHGDSSWARTLARTAAVRKARVTTSRRERGETGLPRVTGRQAGGAPSSRKYSPGACEDSARRGPWPVLLARRAAHRGTAR